eukprot:1758774-Rhodomonas_salina.1
MILRLDSCFKESDGVRPGENCQGLRITHWNPAAGGQRLQVAGRHVGSREVRPRPRTKLYQESGFLYLISRCKPESQSVRSSSKTLIAQCYQDSRGRNHAACCGGLQLSSLPVLGFNKVLPFPLCDVLDPPGSPPKLRETVAASQVFGHAIDEATAIATEQGLIQYVSYDRSRWQQGSTQERDAVAGGGGLGGGRGGEAAAACLPAL